MVKHVRRGGIPHTKIRQEPCYAPVALVTGASRGIGRSVVEELLLHGYRVAAIDITPPDEPFDSAEEFVAGPLLIKADLGNAEAARAIVSKVADAWGRIDVLVNNAAIGGPRALAADLGAVDTPDPHRTRSPQGLSTTSKDGDPGNSVDLSGSDALKEIFDVNLFGPVRLTHEAIEFLRKSGHGRVINLGSIFSERPSRFDSAYSMTKSALTAFTRSLALEEGEHGVTANIIAPGLILTEMHRSEVASQAFELDIDEDERLAQLRNSVPVGRHGSGRDIATLVTWLASEASSYVTGQTFTVDGGVTIGQV